MPTAAKVSVCFVCLGNICRSPTAEGVMLKLVADAGLSEQIRVDSAGTGAYHAGEPADARSRAEALAHGVDLTSVARQFDPEDFGRFDYIVAMDRRNHRDLHALARNAKDLEKLHLFRFFEFGTDPVQGDANDVPDPYHGGDDGFERVYAICVAGCRGLLDQIRREHGL